MHNFLTDSDHGSQVIETFLIGEPFINNNMIALHKEEVEQEEKEANEEETDAEAAFERCRRQCFVFSDKLV